MIFLHFTCLELFMFMAISYGLFFTITLLKNMSYQWFTVWRPYTFFVCAIVFSISSCTSSICCIIHVAAKTVTIHIISNTEYKYLNFLSRWVEGSINLQCVPKIEDSYYNFFFQLWNSIRNRMCNGTWNLNIDAQSVFQT